MIITIKLHTCTDGDAAIAGTTPRELVVAYGYLPSGQLFIQSGKAVSRADYKTAIRNVIGWIFKNRPGWSFLIEDDRMTHVEVAS